MESKIIILSKCNWVVCAAAGTGSVLTRHASMKINEHLIIWRLQPTWRLQHLSTYYYSLWMMITYNLKENNTYNILEQDCKPRNILLILPTKRENSSVYKRKESWQQKIKNKSPLVMVGDYVILCICRLLSKCSRRCLSLWVYEGEPGHSVTLPVRMIDVPGTQLYDMESSSCLFFPVQLLDFWRPVYPLFMF